MKSSLWMSSFTLDSLLIKDKWLNCLGTRVIHDLLPRSEKASFPKFPVATFPLNRAKPLKQDLRPNLTTSSSLLTPAHISTTKGKQLCFPNDRHNQSKLWTEPKTDPEKDPVKSRSNLHSNYLRLVFPHMAVGDYTPCEIRSQSKSQASEGNLPVDCSGS